MTNISWVSNSGMDQVGKSTSQNLPLAIASFGDV